MQMARHSFIASRAVVSLIVSASSEVVVPGEMTVTVSLKKVSVGTEVSIVQEGVPDVIPAEACYLGWQESLTLLAKLVEAEIPD